MDKFNILPIDITLDIFARLPSESVLDCKLVSKTWRCHIQQPSFSQMHLTRLNRYAANDDSGKLSFLSLSKDKNLYYFEYNENHRNPINKIRRIILPSPFKDNNSSVGSPNVLKYDNTLLGSFNGLICIRDESDVSFCICNPMTKEYVILPEPGTNPGQNCASGFGYLRSTNEYKVVTLYREYKELNSLNVMVYTLGSGSGWRNVGKSDIQTHLLSSRDGVFLNGALYWVKVSFGMIVVFDLADEKFLEHLPPPALPQPPSYCNWISHSIGVLGGLLVYTATYAYIYHDQTGRNISYHDIIWLYRKRINNYDIKEQQEKYQPLGWTKEFNLYDNKVLEFTKSGGVLIYNSQYLSIYDPNALTTKMPVNFSTEKFCQVYPHKNTLVSLKELGEKDTKIMESR